MESIRDFGYTYMHTYATILYITTRNMPWLLQNQFLVVKVTVTVIFKLTILIMSKGLMITQYLAFIL